MPIGGSLHEGVRENGKSKRKMVANINGEECGGESPLATTTTTFNVVGSNVVHEEWKEIYI